MPRRSRLVTWSPSCTLVPTRSCFNACTYCGFRQPIGASAWLTDQQASDHLDQRPGAYEVLLLSGEVAPAAPDRAAWFARLLALSRLALRTGRLPHTNAGPLSRREMAALARLNPSMGLMLEGLSPAHDLAHRAAPSKTLRQRLAQLEQAGRLGIPFTTGLLVGLGESQHHGREALELLALLQRQWGHIQEVILQPWRPGGEQAGALSPAQQQDCLGLIAMAREILPPEVHLQLPPNLWPRERLLEAIEAGIDDLGGIDSEDVINPQYLQPNPTSLAAQLAAGGWTLQPRLAVHGTWIPALPPALRARAFDLRRQIVPLQHRGC